MFEDPERKPKLTEADLKRLRQNFAIAQNPEAGMIFPSGTIIVADPDDLGYTPEALELIEVLRRDRRLRQPFINDWEKVALLDQGFIFFPGADCSFFVSEQSDGAISLVHARYNDQTSNDFEKARFEAIATTATLLVGDFYAFKGDLTYALPPHRYWWPNSDLPKVPSTAYGQALHVNPAIPYSLNARLRSKELIRDFTLQPLRNSK